MSSDKGKFSADISSSVIEEALKSVKNHDSRAAPEPAGTASPAPPPAAEEGVSVSVEGEPAAASPGPPAESAELASLRAQLELSQAKGRELMEKIRDEHDRAVRAVADLENFKKRAQKEKEEVSRFGQERLLKDFLPVADNFERAVEHAGKGADVPSLLKGLEMIRKLFEDTLQKHGLKGFSAVGKPFDPRLHEAMGQKETAEVPANSVVSEMVKGYTLHDRLLRPALVTVAKAPTAAAAPPPAADGPAPPAAADGREGTS